LSVVAHAIESFKSRGTSARLFYVLLSHCSSAWRFLLLCCAANGAQVLSGSKLGCLVFLEQLYIHTVWVKV